MDETWNGVPLSEIGAMTHWPEQPNPVHPIIEAVRRYLQSGDYNPVHEPGTQPADYLRELARNPDIMAKNIEQASNFNFGGVMKPIKGGGVRMGTPEFEDYPRAVDVRSNMNENLRFPDFERQQAALKASQSVPLSAIGSEVPALRAPPAGITAYHASPYDFDRFDFSKIGTGEGAQAFGHGGYFAGNEAVSKEGYLPQLKDKVWATGGRDKINAGEAFDQITQAMREAAPGLHPDHYRGIADQLFKGIESHGSAAKYLGEYELPQGQFASASKAAEDWALSKGLKVNPGHMYQVAIKADPEHFLDWDKPLSEQSPKVQEAIKSIDPAYFERNREEINTGSLGEKFKRGLLPRTFDPEKAAEVYRQAGIPGIKYLDQGSRATSADAERGLVRVQQKLEAARARAAGDPSEANSNRLSDLEQELASAQRAVKESSTRNYVVFDDKTIDILKKYGLIGLFGGAGAGATSSLPPER